MAQVFKKRVDMLFTEAEMEFLEWQAKRDGKTIKQEIQMILQLELEYEMDLYADEMRAEKACAQE